MGIILKRLHTDAVVMLPALCVLLACTSPGADGPARLPEQSPDAAPEFPRAGFGSISGDCDVLDSELIDTQPSMFRSSINFEHGYADADSALLTMGARTLLSQGNAGGSSLLSEVFAFEVLQRCEGATLLKTETQIGYDTQSKITDFLAQIDAQKIGVSVTRAVGYPFDAPYRSDQAVALLQKKLGDILASSSSVSSSDRWKKQVLAILAYDPDNGDTIANAWMGLDAATRADTVVWVITTNGADDFIYCNGACR